MALLRITHQSFANRDSLKKDLPERWIVLGGSIEWPPRSPELVRQLLLIVRKNLHQTLFFTASSQSDRAEKSIEASPMKPLRELMSHFLHVLQLCNVLNNCRKCISDKYRSWCFLKKSRRLKLFSGGVIIYSFVNFGIGGIIVNTLYIESTHTKEQQPVLSLVFLLSHEYSVLHCLQFRSNNTC